MTLIYLYMSKLFHFLCRKLMYAITADAGFDLS